MVFQLVAVKVLKKAQVYQADEVDCAMVCRSFCAFLKLPQTERRVLGLCAQSPFLTRLYGSFTSPENLFLVMEPLMGGDLMHRLLEHGTYPIKAVTFYTAELW